MSRGQIYASIYLYKWIVGARGIYLSCNIHLFFSPYSITLTPPPCPMCYRPGAWVFGSRLPRNHERIMEGIQFSFSKTNMEKENIFLPTPGPQPGSLCSPLSNTPFSYLDILAPTNRTRAEVLVCLYSCTCISTYLPTSVVFSAADIKEKQQKKVSSAAGFSWSRDELPVLGIHGSIV